MFHFLSNWLVLKGQVFPQFLIVIFDPKSTTELNEKNLQMSLKKPQIWPKIENLAKIITKQQILVFVTISSTNL